MSDDTRRVLDLLAQGKITVDEAHRLLKALGEQTPRPGAASHAESGDVPKPRFIRIHVYKPGRDGREPKDVNIRVPLAVVRGGMRLGTMIPGWQQWMQACVKEHGKEVELGKLDPEAIEELLREAGEMNIDVGGTGERVRITLE
jgi:hypothetical protein